MCLVSVRWKHLYFRSFILKKRNKSAYFNSLQHWLGMQLIWLSLQSVSVSLSPYTHTLEEAQTLQVSFAAPHSEPQTQA